MQAYMIFKFCVEIVKAFKQRFVYCAQSISKLLLVRLTPGLGPYREFMELVFKLPVSSLINTFSLIHYVEGVHVNNPQLSQVVFAHNFNSFLDFWHARK